MIQSYPLGNSTTLIDGGNIATGTVVASKLYSGEVEADLIHAENLAVGSVQAEHLSIGPQFNFRTTAGGQQLTVNTDGSFSLPGINRNPTDARWVADANHSHPATQLVKHFAATFKRPTLSSDHCGIMFNLSDAYGASGLTGILVQLNNTGLFIIRVSGIGSYTQLGSYTVSATGLDRVAVQYYGSQSTPRMRVFFNGAEVGAGLFTDAFLGTSGGVLGGYAGFLLANSNVSITDIVMGSKPTEVEDGAISTQHLQTNTIFANQAVITSVVGGINAGSTTIDGGKLTTGTVVADSARVGAITTAMLDAQAVTTDKLAANAITAEKLSADLAITDVVRSSQYTAGASGIVPSGFKLSGVPFTTTYVDGTTDAACQMEIGGNINMVGHKASDIVGCIFNRSVEYTVPGTYTWVCPSGLYFIELTLVAGGGGGAYGGASKGGGGGGGGESLRRIFAVTPGKSYTITVGTGGAGGTVNSTFYTGGPGTYSGITVDGVSIHVYPGQGGGLLSGQSYRGGDGGQNLEAYQALGATTAGGTGADGESVSGLVFMVSNSGAGGGAGNVSGRRGGNGGKCGGFGAGQGNLDGGGGGGGSSAMGRGGLGGTAGKAGASSTSETAYGSAGGGGAIGYNGGNGLGGYCLLRW